MSLPAGQSVAARHPRASRAFWIAFFLLFAVALVLVSYESAMHFNGVAIDGPFQLYDALRRIQAGYKPGVDFQFFHGMGMPYLYYGLYRLFGGGLAGSEMARQLVAGLAFPTVLIVFFRVFTGQWRLAFCLAGAGLAVAFALRMSAVLFALNGMLGVRSAFPALVPVVLALARTRRARIAAGGIAIGLCLVLSTEQGLAVAMAYCVVGAVSVARSEKRRGQLIESALTMFVAVATLLAVLLLIGGPAGLRGALHYNFQIVPMDQYWFFGAPPNIFVPSWGAGLRMAMQARPIGAALLLGAAASIAYLVRYWRSPAGEPRDRHFALAVLPVYGLLSCGSLVGVFTPAYAQPCWRTIVMIGGLELARIAAQSDARRDRATWLGVPRAVAVSAIGIAAWALLTTPLILAAFFSSVPHILADHVTGKLKFSISGIWPATLREGQDVVNAHTTPSGVKPLVWSTYAGWLEARNGIFNPSFDYIIHALGPDNRRKYVDTFRASRPTLVQTVLPEYSQYEQWLENNDWAFYDELLRWYTVAGTTPWSVLWERRPTPGPSPVYVAQMEVAAGMFAVALPPVPDSLLSPATLLLIDIDYQTRNPLHWIPVVGASPRFLIGLEGAASRTAISLDPFERHTRFPIAIEAGQTPTLHFQTFSLLPGASWTPRRITVSVLPVDARNQRWLHSLLARSMDAGK